jgi:hypothetical protein
MHQPVKKSEWSVAAVAVVLGNLANILESTKKLSGAAYSGIVFVWHGSQVIPISFAVVGYTLLGSLTFRWLRTRQQSKAVSIGAAFVVASLLLATNLIAVPVTRTPESVWQKGLAQVRTRLFSASSGRGFRWDPGDAKSEVDAWGTAQALVGFMTDRATTLQRRDEIRGAILYLQQIRLADGWGYFPNNNWSLTEITSWVTLASIRSLRADVWTQSERQQRIAEIGHNLAALLERQDESGGWRPIHESADGLARTYSTAIALWAFLDARSEPLLSANVGKRYDDNIRRAVSWLLVHQNHSAPGWIPNPVRENVRETFPGLTAQVLFVLARADQVDQSFVNSRVAYDDAKMAFLDCLSAPTCASRLDTRVPDADVHLRPTDRVLEGSTFLWFPWTLATVSDLTLDQDLTADARKTADRFRDELLSRHEEITEGLGVALTYALGEHLICVDHALTVLRK